MWRVVCVGRGDGGKLSPSHTHASLKHPGMHVNSVYYGFDNEAAKIAINIADNEAYKSTNCIPI